MVIPTAIFASGRGTNLQAVIDAVNERSLPLELRLVVCNNPRALALQRARQAGIPTALHEFSQRAQDRSQYALRLAGEVRTAGARLVLLLGWMHVFAREFLQGGFDVLNLHPAYLPEDPSADSVTFPDGSITPAFRGAHALRDAIAAGVQDVGASLIAITDQIDRGRVLARKPMRLKPGEDESAALTRLHALEQQVVREGVLRWQSERSQA